MSFSLNWCISTLGCPEATLEDAAQLAERHGIRNLELRTLEDRVDLPAYFAERFGSAQAVTAVAQRHGCRIVALDPSAKLVGLTQAHREELAAIAPWADQLGVRYLRVFDGGAPAPELSDEDLAAARDALDWWRAQQQQHGWKVELMLETHDCLCSLAAIERLQAALPHPANILWDAHHTWRKQREDPLRMWPRIKDQVVHIHFKDSIGKPSARHPFTYVHLGEGEFPLQPFLEMLERDRFAGPVSLEWEKKWHPYLPDLDAALTVFDAMRAPA
ncbi:MAG: TIM barrel protein [Verrucomicrobiota bacterium JB022]|nr:TIM barrel protein [Verrucomicrobiota bacterium JB022]